MAVMIAIDTSDLDSLVDGLKKRLTPAQVDRAMSSVLRDTAEHAKQILKTAIPEHYYATPGEVGKSVGPAKITSGGLGVGCCIPITGARKSIGGGFPATGGARGWESLHRQYRVKARIVKGAQSTLPRKMNSYGGQAPFRNFGSRLSGLTFTGAGKERLPIRKVVGIAIPQMASNRAREDIEHAIKERLEKSTGLKINALVRGG